MVYSIDFDEALTIKTFDHINNEVDIQNWEWPPTAEYVESLLQRLGRLNVLLYDQAGEQPWESWRDIGAYDSDESHGAPLTWSIEERRRRLSFSSPRLH